ncbi:hypothetical protein JZX87_30390 [Agrobacterium sp. Ap1]|uniref:helix-turn-helix transcriptional regulator n=1 Tax=Agrobacterium sp. Ap1 TaxID=2815337 RepID=UPI001A8F1559|nr:hypothetical protein [Agrobacterium sp. Ap1]MBO0145432.1 hypothetical protein [Agrobacterium sp. Ap1]
MSGSSVRKLTIPRFALRRDEAAASLGISVSLFLVWVAKGRMPKGRKIDGVVLWDADEVGAAWLRILDGDASSEDDSENPYDKVVA